MRFVANKWWKYVAIFENQVVAQSCLGATPRYIHQLLAFPKCGLG